MPTSDQMVSRDEKQSMPSSSKVTSNHRIPILKSLSNVSIKQRYQVQARRERRRQKKLDSNGNIGKSTQNDIPQSKRRIWRRLNRKKTEDTWMEGFGPSDLGRTQEYSFSTWTDGDLWDSHLQSRIAGKGRSTNHVSQTYSHTKLMHQVRDKLIPYNAYPQTPRYSRQDQSRAVFSPTQAGTPGPLLGTGGVTRATGTDVEMQWQQWSTIRTTKQQARGSRKLQRLLYVLANPNKSRKQRKKLKQSGSARVMQNSMRLRETDTSLGESSASQDVNVRLVGTVSGGFGWHGGSKRQLGTWASGLSQGNTVMGNLDEYLQLDSNVANRAWQLGGGGRAGGWQSIAERWKHWRQSDYVDGGGLQCDESTRQQQEQFDKYMRCAGELVDSVGGIGRGDKRALHSHTAALREAEVPGEGGMAGNRVCTQQDEGVGGGESATVVGQQQSQDGYNDENARWMVDAVSILATTDLDLTQDLHPTPSPSPEIPATHPPPGQAPDPTPVQGSAPDSSLPGEESIQQRTGSPTTNLWLVPPTPHCYKHAAAAPPQDPNEVDSQRQQCTAELATTSCEPDAPHPVLQADCAGTSTGVDGSSCSVSMDLEEPSTPVLMSGNDLMSRHVCFATNAAATWSSSDSPESGPLIDGACTGAASDSSTVLAYGMTRVDQKFKQNVVNPLYLHQKTRALSQDMQEEVQDACEEGLECDKLLCGHVAVMLVVGESIPASAGSVGEESDGEQRMVKATLRATHTHTLTATTPHTPLVTVQLEATYPSAWYQHPRVHTRLVVLPRHVNPRHNALMCDPHPPIHPTPSRAVVLARILLSPHPATSPVRLVLTVIPPVPTQPLLQPCYRPFPVLEPSEALSVALSRSSSTASAVSEIQDTIPDLDSTSGARLAHVLDTASTKPTNSATTDSNAPDPHVLDAVTDAWRFPDLSNGWGRDAGEASYTPFGAPLLGNKPHNVRAQVYGEPYLHTWTQDVHAPAAYNEPLLSCNLGRVADSCADMDVFTTHPEFLHHDLTEPLRYVRSLALSMMRDRPQRTYSQPVSKPMAPPPVRVASTNNAPLPFFLNSQPVTRSERAQCPPPASPAVNSTLSSTRQHIPRQFRNFHARHPTSTSLNTSASSLHIPLFRTDPYGHLHALQQSSASQWPSVEALAAARHGVDTNVVQWAPTRGVRVPGGRQNMYTNSALANQGNRGQVLGVHGRMAGPHGAMHGPAGGQSDSLFGSSSTSIYGSYPAVRAMRVGSWLKTGMVGSETESWGASAQGGAQKIARSGGAGLDVERKQQVLGQIKRNVGKLARGLKGWGAREQNKVVHMSQQERYDYLKII